MTRSVSFRVFVAVGFALGVTALGAFVVRLSAGELPPELMLGAHQKPKQPTREWQLVDGKHWQIVGPEGEDPRITDKLETTRGNCADGMVEVQGKMKSDISRRSLFDPNTVEEMQKRTCTKWITKEYPERCAEFDRDKWLALSKDLPLKPMHYCMDRFEYPNRRGVNPMIFVTFYEAEQKCQAQGKRLCNEEEWTFACEGEEATPYPYGYVRSPEKCPISGGPSTRSRCRREAASRPCSRWIGFGKACRQARGRSARASSASTISRATSTSGPPAPARASVRAF